MGTESKTILQIYAALTVSVALSFLPVMSAAVIALLLFAGTFAATYILRRKAAPGSLCHNHMTYVIVTLWVAGFFTLLTMSAATAYILNVYDPSPLLSCADGLSSMTDMAAIEAAIKPCFGAFIELNMRYFINGTIMAAAPVIIYLGYRIAKGVFRAARGHRIGDVKNWF